MTINQRLKQLTMAAMLLSGTAFLAACGEPDNELESIAVDPDAAMDTTPAGTPAPPSPDIIAEDQGGEIVAHLTEWAIELSSATVPAGEVTFQVMNMGSIEHALEVEGQGIEEETENIEPGGTGMLTVNLTPGTYTIYCPIVGDEDHEQRGMTTTLTVTAAG
jgi:uncharacterized cupredoxin-like copper-binding protein